MKIALCLPLLIAVPHLAYCQRANEKPSHRLGQTIIVRLLNAKTGKPMNDKMVTFKWERQWKRSEVKSDQQGLGTVEVPTGEEEFTLLAGPKIGKDPCRIPYLDCNERWDTFIQVSLVIEKGYVPQNTCGEKSATAHPGEIVFWLLPLPWWMPDMQ